MTCGVCGYAHRGQDHPPLYTVLEQRAYETKTPDAMVTGLAPASSNHNVAQDIPAGSLLSHKSVRTAVTNGMQD